MLVLLIACTSTERVEGEDSGADELPDVATQMPDHGGCTLEWSATSQGAGEPYVEVRRLYDDEERLIEEATAYEGEAWTATWTYDEAGCLVAYDGAGYSYTQTCDEHGNVVHAEATRDGSSATADTVWTYDGDLPVRAVTTTWNDQQDETWVTEEAWTWDDDGHMLTETESEDGEVDSVKTWTYDGDLVVTYVLERPDDGYTLAWAYEYDAHGRLVEEEGEIADYEAYSERTLTWFDGLFHVATETEETDTPDMYTSSSEVWSCAETWPWRCVGDVVGDDDGEAYTEVREEVWTCP